MNLNEINKIVDYKEREIRRKYFDLRHEAFKDESGIPDTELEKVWDDLTEKEEAEVAAYLKSLEGNTNE